MPLKYLVPMPIFRFTLSVLTGKLRTLIRNGANEKEIYLLVNLLNAFLMAIS